MDSMTFGVWNSCKVGKSDVVLKKVALSGGVAVSTQKRLF